MQVTDEIFSAYSECKYKGYLKFSEKVGIKQDLDYLNNDLLLSIKENYFNRLSSKFKNEQIIQNFEVTNKALKEGISCVLESSIQNSDFLSHFDALMKVSGKSLLGNFLYEPILLIPKYKISKTDKLMLTFQSLVIKDLQGRQPKSGKIIFGIPIKTITIKTNNYTLQTDKIIKEIRKFPVQEKLPHLILNKHCNLCAFKTARVIE